MMFEKLKFWKKRKPSKEIEGGFEEKETIKEELKEIRLVLNKINNKLT